MQAVYERIQGLDREERRQGIIASYVETYPSLISADPDAWRCKFRKMAGSPFAFYRGSAALFYSDVRDGDDDPFLNEHTSCVWIQGDLHCDNFGTYMNSAGILVFDVNDFDESYVGAFTWDLKRLAASLALLGYQKALSDEAIRRMIETVTRSYVRQVALFAQGKAEHDFALTLSTTQGVLYDILGAARLHTRLGMLNQFTTIEGFDRCFGGDPSLSRLESSARAEVEQAFEAYLATIPESKRDRRLSYRVKDMASRRGVGIGSAGLPSYNVLLEGHTQALENDIILYLKESIPAAPSIAVTDERIRSYFADDAERTVISQRALQAYADAWLGHTTLHGTGYLVAEASPYTADLEWNDVNDLDQILQLLTFLGKAVAKIHCVSDDDSDQTLVPFSTDRAITDALEGREDEFVAHIVAFGLGYGAIAREDYQLFADVFRNGQIADL